jgi:hypothetical protein
MNKDALYFAVFIMLLSSPLYLIVKVNPIMGTAAYTFIIGFMAYYRYLDYFKLKNK